MTGEVRASPRLLLSALELLLRPFLGRDRSRAVIGYWFAVWTLLTHALKAQHGKAVLGLLWTLLVPALFIAVYLPVMASFGVSSSVQAVLGADPLGFPIYVVGGFITWNAFGAGVQNGASSLVSNPGVVHHSPIPLQVLPLVKVLSAMVAWGIAMACLLLFLALAGRWPGVRVLILPGLVVLLTLFLQGLALLLSALAAFFHDLLQVISTLLLVQFFAVPVIYLPQGLPAHLQPLVRLNPLTPFLTLTQALLVPGFPVAWSDAGAAAAWAAGLFLLGSWVFRRLRVSLPDYV